jgi:C4-dicarboxylate transporter/malic acid transport protein
LFAELDRPAHIVSNLTPNWFGSIMGTGIVATAAASLPVRVPGVRTGATVVWAIAAVLLVALTAATVLHWIVFRHVARSHHRNPVMGHFYGAPPMAVLTVGAGTLLLGRDWIGLRAALEVDWILWALGTAAGLVVAVALPYLTFARGDNAADAAFGGWLMPVAAPMISAATGALLVPYAPAGQFRATLLWGCFALFGISLVLTIAIVTLIWQRLVQHAAGPPALVPTLWIVLGPVGQSIVAVNLLAGDAGPVIGRSGADVLGVLALVYGFGMLGFAMVWTVLAALTTARTMRTGLPFSLTWWSFTFAIGACSTACNDLATHSGLVAASVLAVVTYAVLVLVWITVALRTFSGSVIRGTLLVPVE